MDGETRRPPFQILIREKMHEYIASSFPDRARRTPRLHALLCVMAAMLMVHPLFAQLPPTPREQPADGPALPKLVVADRFQDMGSLYEGDKIEIVWLLTNEGDADLTIDGTRTSCGCTVARLADDQRTIGPKQSLELVVEFNSAGRRGTQRKSVVVESNDPNEPKLKLEFVAEVASLFVAKPPGAVSLRMVRRGETPRRDLELRAAAIEHDLEVLGIEVPPSAPISVDLEDLDGGAGARLVFHISDQAPLGPIQTEFTVHLRVNDVQRAHSFQVQGEVVADLVWQPHVVDITRQQSTRGKRLAPVMISSTGKTTFEVIKATAGDALDVQVEPVKSVRKGTRYACTMTIRDDAPDGPFAAELTVYTTSFDQPVLRIPVFGSVVRRCAVTPPVILFRQDKTTIGTRRRIKVQCDPRTTLKLGSATCTNSAVEVYFDRESGKGYRHIKYLEAFLTEKPLAPGIHEAILILETNVPGAERLEIPVRIEVPK